MTRTDASTIVPFARRGDEQLAALAALGDAAAFAVLDGRHRTALTASCRRMLRNQQDAEDAVQETFLRAFRALVRDGAPRAVRPWLHAIARNRCLTLLAARREAHVPLDAVTVGADRLTDDVQARAEVAQVLHDLAALPADQRTALVLSELRAFGAADVASAVGCRREKVKALVFQARSTLAAERTARAIACSEIRRQLATARGGELRRGSLRRHLRGCGACRAHAGPAPAGVPAAATTLVLQAA